MQWTFSARKRELRQTASVACDNSSSEMDQRFFIAAGDCNSKVKIDLHYVHLNLQGMHGGKGEAIGMWSF